MRLWKLGCGMLVIAPTIIGGAEARQPSAARAVQIISMASVPVATPPTHIIPRRESREVPPPVSPSTFRAHDLSRRWVEFDMGALFASPAPRALTPSPNVGAAEGVVRSASVGLDETRRPAGIPPAPMVSIPDWMRGDLASSPIATAFAPSCAAGVYRPAGFLEGEAEGRRFGYYAMMSRVACEHGIPVGLFDAMIIRESRYRPDIFSPKNAYGLTQLMPGTAAGLGVDRYNVEQNLRGGARYLRQQLDRFGQFHLALAAYNAGPGRVRNGLVPQIAETRAYVDNVLLNWRRLAGFSRIAGVRNVDTAVASPSQSGRIATISSY